MPTLSIADHGVTIHRSSPTHALDDVEARRHAVLRALEILTPVVRPLALEVSLGTLDTDTFAVEPREVRRIAIRSLPVGVANLSAFADPPPVELVDVLTFEHVMRVLTPTEPGWDVATITAPVTAARVHATKLAFERLPSRPVPTMEIDGATWVVGPIDAPGYRLAPPIALSWRQDYGDLQLTVAARWNLWSMSGSAELAGLRAAERFLDAAGFAITP